MVNVVREDMKKNGYINGKILLGEILGFYVPDSEFLRITPTAKVGLIDVQLKVRGEGREILAAVGEAQGAPILIEVSIQNNDGAVFRASWKCRGKSMNIPTPFMPTTTTTLKLNAHFYEHIINGEEIFYIDILKYIKRIDGVDHLKKYRELIGLDY